MHCYQMVGASFVGRWQYGHVVGSMYYDMAVIRSRKRGYQLETKQVVALEM